ncbi:MAG: hypothetical protein LBF58_11475 [Deltaproteobacteria bacterium]|jgi:hypothetical protein|nr:hypothetical protein [Deltaproteobacteria bacterium]
MLERIIYGHHFEGDCHQNLFCLYFNDFFATLFFVGVTAAQDVAPLGVSFEFGGDNRGPSAPSPATEVTNIPPDTARLKVGLKDLDSKRYKHGGGQIVIEPSQTSFVIPSGALSSSYKGPHPPKNQTYRYVFTVEALKKDKKAIGTGKAEGTYVGK